MFRRPALSVRILAGLVLLVALGACGGSGATAPANAAPVASLAVTPGSVIVPVGVVLQLAAVPLDARNAAVAGGPAVTWTSSDPAVVGVDPRTGVATARRAGGVTITATCAGKTGAVRVRVISVVAGGAGDPAVPREPPAWLP